MNVHQFLIAAAAASFSPLALAQAAATSQDALSHEELARELVAHVEELVARDAFSGTVLLAHGDEPLVRAAFGQASKRFDVPMRPDTKLNLGSANKMFTGVAICQLAEAGKLDFSDTVAKHLPDYPNRDVAERVTIHHLLTHTSGMGSYWNEKYDQTWTTLREVADMLPLFVDDELSFEPGARFQYSNAGPIVLGLIVEAISGQSYYDYVREHIYAPAGMENTDCYEMDRPVPNLALGYTKGAPDGSPGDGSWRNNLFSHSLRGGPAGGGFSTVDDLLRFSLALQNGDLLSVGMFETLVTGKVSMGGGVRYAYLFGDEEEGNGVHSYGHNGGAPGISADFAFYPELGYTFAVLSNYDDGALDTAHFARELIGRSEEAAALR